MRVARRVLVSLALLLGLAFWTPPSVAVAPNLVGEAIYRQGVLASGAVLDGLRSDSAQGVHGAAAACVHCHRSSGLGSREGAYIIAPISGRHLFRPRSAYPFQQGQPHAPVTRNDREPYTDTTLARAIREGVDPDGKALSYLMPRFALGDDDMAALIAYLKALSPRQVPGVSANVLHFATIIAADADPVKARGVVDVLQHFFADKNAMADAPSRAQLPLRDRGEAAGIPVASMRWQLHVWQLQGPPSEWQAQLRRHFAQEPVLAAVSGLGGTDWSPVHAFCQAARLPCLFPNLEVPVEDDHAFYSLYFSKGVFLEAELFAHRINGETADASAGPVQQVYREADSGEAAAHTLAQALQRAGRDSQPFVIPAGAPARAVRDALARASGPGPLVLWLRPNDLSELSGTPAPGRMVFASGLLGGLENAPLPAEWRQRVLLSYPFDLPGRRLVRVDYPLGWFHLRRIPIVAQQVQVDTYLACQMLVDALEHMGQDLVPDYLIEQMEDMLGHRILTGYYPRLSLAEGQRFASKGGYLVQLAGEGKGAVTAASGWVVP